VVRVDDLLVSLQKRMQSARMFSRKL
jgi:hypothetical protein